MSIGGSPRKHRKAETQPNSRHTLRPARPHRNSQNALPVKEGLMKGQIQLLELIATGAPLEQILRELLFLLEGESAGMRSSIVLLEGDRIWHGAAPNLPARYVQAINGLRIGPKAGSCGTAMSRRKPVISTDIWHDPLWEEFLPLAREYGLRACWSTPIFSSKDELLGSFAMYYDEVHEPTDEEQELAKFGSHIAGIAIERQRNEDHFVFLAQHDMLTGLPNRLMMEMLLDQAIALARRHQHKIGLLFMDMDGFKHINDSLGHPVGDRVLQAVAERLKRSLRKEDNMARVGGDEFLIMLPELPDSGEAGLVAAKTLDALSAPVMVDGHELHVGASIGISVFPADGDDGEALMRAADIAMYHAKEQGRNNYQFYRHSLNEVTRQRLSLENQLRQALARDEFTLHYQPQVDMKSRRIYSAEALLRWEQPHRGLVQPNEFIPLAEEIGLIVPIGEWVLRQACAQLKLWRNAGHNDLAIAVNLSARQVMHPGLADMVAGILAELDLPAEALELEITESVLMQPSDVNLATLRQLSSMGVQLSVDDFGTGYSSLTYLQRFPVSALKIDQSFIGGIGRDKGDMAITNAILGMADSLRLKVVAEGVETQEQAIFLQEHGCESAQGNYYSVPIGAKAFGEMLALEPIH